MQVQSRHQVYQCSAEQVNVARHVHQTQFGIEVACGRLVAQHHVARKRKDDQAKDSDDQVEPAHGKLWRGFYHARTDLALLEFECKTACGSAPDDQ